MFPEQLEVHRLEDTQHQQQGQQEEGTAEHQQYEQDPQRIILEKRAIEAVDNMRSQIC
jgi:hypothetical protein